MNKVIQCFMNVNFCNQHDGLVGIAKKAGLKPDSADQGELFVFLNRAQNKIKVLAPSGGQGPLVMAYARFPSRINLEAIQYLSVAFEGGKINFDQALKTAVQAALSRAVQRKGKISPLTAARMLA